MIDHRPLAAALLIAVLGCAEEKLALPDGDLTAAFGGGRLQPRFMESDGARQLLHFIDTELGMLCIFGETAHDGLRCLPLTSGQLQFTESSCTRAILFSREPGYVATNEAVYRVGDLAEPGSLFAKQGGECDEWYATSPGEPWRVVEEKLDFSDLVEGQLREIDPDVRITRLGVVGADGSWVPGGWFDRELGIECHGDVEEGWCDPRFNYGGVAHDSGCASEVLISDGPVDPYVWTYDIPSPEDACVGLSPRTLRRVLQPYPLDDVDILNADGICSHIPIGGVDRAFRLSEPLDPLATLEKMEGTNIGLGSVVVPRAQTTDGRSNPPSLVYDRTRDLSASYSYLGEFALADGGPCTPVQIEDRIRCVPVGAIYYESGGFGVFADLACTELVLRVGSGELILADVEDAGDPPGLLIAGAAHAPGEEVPLDALFVLNDGTCVRFEKPWCGTYHRIGAPADATIYPELQLTTE